MKTTQTKTIWIFVILLLLAAIFWRWSVQYKTVRMSPVNMEANTMKIGEEPATNEQLENELKASMESSSEIELRAVDSEF